MRKDSMLTQCLCKSLTRDTLETHRNQNFSLRVGRECLRQSGSAGLLVTVEMHVAAHPTKGLGAGARRFWW